MKILIVGPSWVGDMVMAQSLFQALKAQQPQCQIDVLAPRWCEPLLERMPEVNASHTQPIGHGQLALSSRIQLGKNLRQYQYDQAILLPNSFKSAIIPFVARIPLRTGWRGEFRYGLLNDLRKLKASQFPRMVERYVRLAYPANHTHLPPITSPKLISEANQQKHLLEKFSITSANDALALCPGAEFGSAKRWPTDQYAELATHHLSKGQTVLMLGSPKDQTITEEIFTKIPKPLQGNCLNLAGQTTLLDAIDLLAYSKAAVTNDSGLMHIAAAVGTPLVALYGPTSPTYTPPLSDNARIERLKLDCSPCHQRDCPLKHHHCLKRLNVEQVEAALDEII